VTIPPALPKLERTYDAIDATHASVFEPMGCMISAADAVPSPSGPVMPLRRTLMT
jgi:hypothetical protein